MIDRILGFGARAAGGVPIWLWVLGALLIALGGLEMTRRLQVSGLEAQVSKCKAAHAADREQATTAALKQAEAHAAETARRVAAQQEIQRAHDESLELARKDADSARGAARRLSGQLAAYAAAHRRAASDSAAPAERAAAEDPIGVLADLLGRIDERAGVLAAHADAARIAGQQCEQAYDALTLKP